MTKLTSSFIKMAIDLLTQSHSGLEGYNYKIRGSALVNMSLLRRSHHASNCCYYYVPVHLNMSPLEVVKRDREYTPIQKIEVSKSLSKTSRQFRMSRMRMKSRRTTPFTQSIFFARLSSNLPPLHSSQAYDASDTIRTAPIRSIASRTTSRNPTEHDRKSCRLHDFPSDVDEASLCSPLGSSTCIAQHHDFVSPK